jgi:hypothetical protein
MPDGNTPDRLRKLGWTTVPPELWQRVFTYASNTEHRILLTVSRFFRAAVHRILFRAVRIQFGIWESIRIDDLSKEVDLEDLATNTQRQTKELLKRIADDPTFAQVIQSLHVLAYTKQGLDPEGTSYPFTKYYHF